MKIRDLPYPGHSWSFTQHSIAITAATLFGLLKCASPFEGLAGDFSAKITDLMVHEEILTPNERDGRPDAWRDYQQVLAELGLIYSTLISPVLTFTDAGHMFLAGEIGFSELIGTQAARYQYPNGQKSTIQRRLSKALNDSGISFSGSMIELQAQRGVLLKPAILILRLLIELTETKNDAHLSVSECQAFLIPCARNSEWPVAFSDIVAWRKMKSQVDIDIVNSHSRRNIQDWFNFLKKSDIFSAGSMNTIRLSDYALQNLTTIKQLCGKEEAIDSFWIPSAFTREEKLTWFNWYGHIPFAAQGLLKSDDLDDEYIERNYIGGIEYDDEDQETGGFSSFSMNLKPVDFDALSRDVDFVFNDNEDLGDILARLKRGAYKRHSKTLLHDQIVRDLAERFQCQGATVLEDKNSIDLMAKWPKGEEAIFEVKTVSRRNLQDRMRKAIGQVEEYAYRRRTGNSQLVDRIIVVNTDIDKSAWQVDFLNQHMGIGLICKAKTNYCGYPPFNAASKRFWG